MQAEDGTDIAVDLERPCHNGDIVLCQEGKSYVVNQLTEKVIRIALPQEPSAAARLGWFLGNQHLQVEVMDEFIQLAHDALLLKKLQQADLNAEVTEDVFSPAPHSGGHHHHHHH